MLNQLTTTEYQNSLKVREDVVTPFDSMWKKTFFIHNKHIALQPQQISSPAKSPELTRYPVMGVSITAGTPEEFLNVFEKISTNRNSSYVCFVNVHMLVEAQRDASFADIINTADIACPDGKPVARCLKWFYSIEQSRIAGPDTISALLHMAELCKKRVFVLGSKNEILDAFVKKATIEHPHTTICGTYSPPFRPLTKKEDDDIVSMINQSQADMIFVALGCPKQEKWMAEHKGRINGTMYGIGYAIPVYAGFERRAPAWMQACSLEWLYRLLHNPKRLLKRYVVTNSIFIVSVIKELFQKKEFKHRTIG